MRDLVEVVRLLSEKVQKELEQGNEQFAEKVFKSYFEYEPNFKHSTSFVDLDKYTLMVDILNCVSSTGFSSIKYVTEGTLQQGCQYAEVENYTENEDIDIQVVLGIYRMGSYLSLVKEIGVDRVVKRIISECNDEDWDTELEIDFEI